MHIDYAVRENCINIYSYGMICVHCGCCGCNQNYRNMIRRRITYYKERLEEQYSFSDWVDDEKWRKVQEQNLKANIIYFKRKIRLYKKILRTKGKVEQCG